jgi:hypothetical protein
LETEPREFNEGRDLRWIGAHVSGKCGFVKGEKPVYPNWWIHFHPARKDEETEKLILGIEFPG